MLRDAAQFETSRADRSTFEDVPKHPIGKDKFHAIHATEATTLTDITFYKTARTLFREIGVTLHYLTDDFEEGEHDGISFKRTLKDYMKSPIPAKYLIETDDLHAACQIARENGFQIVIIGALTSGTENFGPPGIKYDSDRIMAIRPKSLNPIVTEAQIEEYTPSAQREGAASEHSGFASCKRRELPTNQIKLLKDSSGKITRVKIGAGIIPDDLNATLAQHGLYVPIDLTTKNSAMMGAIFATGAMGPSRIRPSQVIKKATISNGSKLRTIEGDEIEGFEGMLGLNGAVVEIELEVYEVPKHQFGLMVPLNVEDANPANSNWPEKLAQLLAALLPALNVKLADGKISSDWPEGYINGVEIFTRSELEFVLEKSANDEVKILAERALAQMAETDSKFLVSITGRSQKNIYDHSTSEGDPLEILCELLKKGEIGEPMNASSSLKTLHALREEVPDLAKAEGSLPDSPKTIIFTTSTDINTIIDPAHLLELQKVGPEARITALQELYHQQLQANLVYEQELDAAAQAFIARKVRIIIRRYGHGNPTSLNLHTRATVKGSKEDKTAFDEAVATVKRIKAAFTRSLLDLRSNPNLRVLHGEKGIPPSLDLLTEDQIGNIVDTLKANEHDTLSTFGWRLKGTRLGNLMATYKQPA